MVLGKQRRFGILQNESNNFALFGPSQRQWTKRMMKRKLEKGEGTEGRATFDIQFMYMLCMNVVVVDYNVRWAGQAIL